MTPRSQKIDLPMCRRVKSAFKRLGMTYAAIAADAGIPSKAQLIDIANGKIDASKRVLKYLCSKGFSAQWLFTGEGSELWLDKEVSTKSSALIVKQLKKDIGNLTSTLEECADQIANLKATLKKL